MVSCPSTAPSWSEQSNVMKSWAKEERGRIGEERFRREHECEFLILTKH